MSCGSLHDHILDVPVQEKQKAFAEVELFGGTFTTTH